MYIIIINDHTCHKCDYLSEIAAYVGLDVDQRGFVRISNKVHPMSYNMDEWTPGEAMVDFVKNHLSANMPNGMEIYKLQTL